RRRTTPRRHSFRGRRGVLRSALELLAEELTVAHAQDLLIDAELVGSPLERLLRKARALADQRLGVDDDLALAAEVRGHRPLYESFHPGRRCRALGWPSQDQARARCDVGLRLAIV